MLLLFLAAGSALAAGRICISRDTMQFGNQQTGTAVTQSSVVTNCGDAPFTFTGVSTHPATAAAFGIATSCTTGQALQPAQTCSVDVTFAPVTPGQVSGGVWLHNTTSTPDQIVTFYGRGVNAQAGSATLEFAPAVLTFDPQAVGTTSPSRTVALRNLGPAPLTLRALVINGATPYDFSAPGNCMLGMAIPAGGSCELHITFTPAATGARSARLNVDAPELANIAVMSIGGVGVAPGPPTVDVVEFFNAPLNHFFLTAVREEADAIDSGVVGPSWQRTGLSFKSYAAQPRRRRRGRMPLLRHAGHRTERAFLHGRSRRMRRREVESALAVRRHRLPRAPARRVACARPPPRRSSASSGPAARSHSRGIATCTMPRPWPACAPPAGSRRARCSARRRSRASPSVARHY